MKPPLLVVGHSHVDPVFSADASSGRGATDGIARVAVDHVVVMSMRGVDEDAYWDAAVAAAPGNAVGVVWDGDQHLRAFQAAPAPPIDFVLAAAPDLPLDPRASYVSEAQLRAFFAPSFTRLPGLLARLRAAATGPVLLAGTPPPAAPESVTERAANDPRIAALAVEQGIEPAAVELTSPYTLQKLWSLIQVLLAEIAREAGVTFVPVPDRLRGEDGFLHPRLLGADLAATNQYYTLEMLAELDRAAGATA